MPPHTPRDYAGQMTARDMAAAIREIQASRHGSELPEGVLSRAARAVVELMDGQLDEGEAIRELEYRILLRAADLFAGAWRAGPEEKNLPKACSSPTRPWWPPRSVCRKKMPGPGCSPGKSGD